MDKKSLIKYILALLLFGSNGIVASYIALGSYEIVFLRTFIGSVFLAVLFLLGKGTFHIKENKRDTIFIVLSGIAMGTSWMFLYEAYQQIGVSFASLLYYCGPVIVMILSSVIFQEKLTISKTAGFIVVLIGIILVNGNTSESSNNIWGLFCGGMSAVMYFFMVTCNKKAKKISGMENAVLQLVISFLTVAVFVGLKQGFIVRVLPDDWIWVFILGVLNTGIGCYLYFSSLSKIPVQTVAVCGYLEPLSAVVFANILLGELLSPLQIVGAICIIGGAMIGELTGTKKR